MPVIKEPNYTQYPNVILDELNPVLSGTQFKVISAIVRFTFGYHIDGPIPISTNKLVKATGLTRKTVINALDSLENEHNAIKGHKSQGKTTRWEIVFDSDELVYEIHQTCVGNTPVRNGTSVGNTPVTSGLKKKDIKENNKERDSIDYLEYLPESLNTPEFLEVWELWEMYRRKVIHKKLVPFTRKRQFKLLSSVPLKIAIYMLNKAMDAGWQGLFKPKPYDPIWKEVEEEQELEGSDNSDILEMFKQNAPGFD